MITLKLTHGLSHNNGFVRATRENPFVNVESEDVAKKCVESGFFERVTDGNANGVADSVAIEKRVQDEKSVKLDPAAESAQPTTEDDELDAMTVPELKAYAETVGIDLGKLTKKADIIAAIRKAEAE